MAMTIQGTVPAEALVPPRPPKPPPPSPQEVAAQVAAAAAECQAAAAAEAALLDERQALKARQQALAQDRKVLAQQHLTPRKRAQAEAIVRERQDELEEQDYALTQRQQAARVRAGRAVEALKRARHALGRRRQEG